MHIANNQASWWVGGRWSNKRKKEEAGGVGLMIGATLWTSFNTEIVIKMATPLYEPVLSLSMHRLALFQPLLAPFPFLYWFWTNLRIDVVCNLARVPYYKSIRIIYDVYILQLSLASCSILLSIKLIRKCCLTSYWVFFLVSSFNHDISRFSVPIILVRCHIIPQHYDRKKCNAVKEGRWGRDQWSVLRFWFALMVSGIEN